MIKYLALLPIIGTASLNFAMEVQPGNALAVAQHEFLENSRKAKAVELTRCIGLYVLQGDDKWYDQIGVLLAEGADPDLVFNENPQGAKSACAIHHIVQLRQAMEAHHQIKAFAAAQGIGLDSDYGRAVNALSEQKREELLDICEHYCGQRSLEIVIDYLIQLEQMINNGAPARLQEVRQLLAQKIQSKTEDAQHEDELQPLRTRQNQNNSIPKKGSWFSYNRIVAGFAIAGIGAWLYRYYRADNKRNMIDE